ncbi:MAG: GDP-mannose 4,6-dehydratase, partial [Promethearchaeota archaeon]
IFRMSCIYGTEQFGFEEQGWVSHIIFKHLRHEKIEIYGNGKQVRDLLFIDDLAELIFKFIAYPDQYNSIQLKEKNTHQSNVFNVGGGIKNSISLIELLQILKDLSKYSSNFHISNWRSADQKFYVSDIQKISKILDWNPKISPREGIKRIYYWGLKFIENLKEI